MSIKAAKQRDQLGSQRQFQEAWGLEARGTLDQQTLNKLDHTLQRARKHGIPQGNIGTFNGHVVRINGANYRLQLLWRVAGHFDHVHLGIRRA